MSHLPKITEMTKSPKINKFKYQNWLCDSQTVVSVSSVVIVHNPVTSGECC